MTIKLGVSKDDNEKSFLSTVSKIFNNVFGCCLRAVDQFVSFILNKNLSYGNEAIDYARAPIKFGLLVVFLFFVLGGFWAAFAPLVVASHAQGVVISQISHQSLQTTHPGRVKKFFVKQGDFVNQNQVLMELEGNEYRAEYVTSIVHYLDLVSRKDRLMAQRDNLKELIFSNMLVDHSAVHYVVKMMDVQKRLFEQYLDFETAQEVSYQKKVDKIKENIKIFDMNISSDQKRLKYISDSLAINQKLESQGFAASVDTTKLLAEQSGCLSELNRHKSERMKCDIDLQDLKAEISSRKNKRIEENLRELERVNQEITRAYYSLVRGEEAYKGVFIRSPIKGVVNHIAKDSYVFGANMLVADITPNTDDLVIEVSISVDDVDHVRIGQEVAVKFSSFKARVSPVFRGTLVSLSPNTAPAQIAGGQSRFSDPMKQQKPFYTGVIKVNKKELDEFLQPRNLKLMAGMRADVMVITGKKTLFRYLLDPVLDQSFKSLKEQ